MQAGNQYVLRTTRAQFAGGALANAAVYADLPLPPQLIPGRMVLRSIAVVSKQNLAWEFIFFRTKTPPDITGATFLDSYYLAGRWGFQAADGVQIAGAGPYLYYIDGLRMLVEDIDDRVATPPNPVLQAVSNTNPPKLHVALVNRSATAKSADSGGDLVVEFRLEPLATGG